MVRKTFTLYLFRYFLCLINSLLGLLFVLYQKRRESESFVKTNDQGTADLSDMPLYAVVNKNRDSMVSYSASEGAVDFEKN